MQRNSLIRGIFKGIKNLVHYNQRQGIATTFQTICQSSSRSLWIFSENSRIRRFCQTLVPPGFGSRNRIQKSKKQHLIWNAFSIFMFLCTIGLIVIASYVTPIYYSTLPDTVFNWYVITETIFFAIFTFELVVKVIADGFIFADIAYLRTIWGGIDFLVWITLFANLLREIFMRHTTNRIVGAFKALRALRLLSISSGAKRLFHDIMIVGLWKIFTATIVALSLLFPFALWGLNIFKGRLLGCNDDSISGSLYQCTGEYLNTPFDWDVLSPRVVSNPTYDFDKFGHSLLVMFEIISLEGWADVLVSVMSITEPHSQPKFSSHSPRGVFIILYNTISTIFIMTLFLSVIIQNYSLSTGTGYYTEPQRKWSDIKKALSYITPSVLPNLEGQNKFRIKLYEEFSKQRSWIYAVMFLTLWAIAITLVTEFYDIHKDFGDDSLVRWVILFTFTAIYLFFLFLKCYAFGMKKYFRRLSNGYAFFVTFISFIFQVGWFFFSKSTDSSSGFSYTYDIFRKLFYVGMLLLFIPYSKRIHQLMKTARTSIVNISQLLFVWFILYMVFAIAFNQVFGKTKFGPNGSTIINFRTIPNALVLLFRMSCGEGWNDILADYREKYPQCIGRDCGSSAYSYILFIAWNILSMYIFANLFISLVFDQFSYVASVDGFPINLVDVRHFKNTWGKHNSNSDKINISKLNDFLKDCRGYFSFHIHEEPWTINTIKYELNRRMENDSEGSLNLAEEINRLLAFYPVKEIEARRLRYNQFYYHALAIADESGFIKFDQLISLIALYKMDDYTGCLNIRDWGFFLEVNKKVEAIRKKHIESGYKKTVKYMLRKRLLLHNRNISNNKSVFITGITEVEPEPEPESGHGSRPGSRPGPGPEASTLASSSSSLYLSTPPTPSNSE